jgi:uncharacterized repeat protein (TIGR03843 family)
MQIAVFDALVNNADRKAGHLLTDENGNTYGIDHGVTFNSEDKLRTVLWGWIGQRISDSHLADLEKLDKQTADKPTPKATVEPQTAVVKPTATPSANPNATI